MNDGFPTPYRLAYLRKSWLKSFKIAQQFKSTPQDAPANPLWKREVHDKLTPNDHEVKTAHSNFSLKSQLLRLDVFVG